MGCEPCSTHVPRGPRGVTHTKSHRIGHSPYIRVMPHAPSSLYAIVVTRGLCTAHGKLVYKLQQGLVHLRKVTCLRVPVVLLQVYVSGIVTAPWWSNMLIPQSLQICRHPFRARATDKQVSAILEIEGLQFRVFLFQVIIAKQLAVGCQSAHTVCRMSQAETHPVEELLVIRTLRLTYILVSLFPDSTSTPARHCLIVHAVSGRVILHTVKACHINYIQGNRFTPHGLYLSGIADHKPSAVTSDGGTAVVSLISSAMA